MKKLALSFAALSVLAFAACKKEEGKVVDTKTTSETTTKPAEPAKPAETTTTTTTTTTTAEGETGVAECDKFVTAYRACVEKMPEAARGPANDGLKQMVDAWKQAASQGDAAKDALKTGCKSAYDNSKQAMAAACPDVKWD